ncbi:unnamed protein product, partial [Didymodactylos carnosus]
MMRRTGRCDDGGEVGSRVPARGGSATGNIVFRSTPLVDCYVSYSTMEQCSNALDKKDYKQIKGGAMGSAVTQILADVYMVDWGYLDVTVLKNPPNNRFRTIVFRKPAAQP